MPGGFQGVLYKRKEGATESEPNTLRYVVVGLVVVFGFVMLAMLANVLCLTCFRRERRRGDHARTPPFNTPPGTPPGPARAPEVDLAGLIPLQAMGPTAAAAAAEGRGRRLGPDDHRQRGRRESIGRDNSHRRAGAAYLPGRGHSTDTLPLYRAASPQPPSYFAPRRTSSEAPAPRRSSSSTRQQRWAASIAARASPAALSPSDVVAVAGMMGELEGMPRNVARPEPAAAPPRLRRRLPRLPSPAPGAPRSSTVPEAAADDDPTPRARHPSPPRRRTVYLSSSPYAADPAPRPREPPATSSARAATRPQSPLPSRLRRSSSSSMQTVDLDAPPHETLGTCDSEWQTVTPTTPSCATERSPARRSSLAGPGPSPYGE